QHGLEQAERAVELRDLDRAADTQARDLARRQAGDVAALVGDRAAIGLEVAGDHVDEGGLAGAVGADQADHRVLLDRRADLGRRGHRAERLAQTARLQNYRHCARSRPAADHRPSGRKTISASNAAPRLICQVLGETSYAMVWIAP